ncbi:MAG: hypothetical protein JST92_00870, partial [Deltaproteobacteria bacterium]|nr:hypothetical protein [Deltaproteobacteria bacterium]
MLPALSAGLREGGKFEVTGLPYADLGPVAQASESTDVLVLFYGSPARTLPQALEQLAAPLRARGARVIAVLQKDTAGQRDDCFRHGASDVLFMPLPKEAFVQKVIDAALLALPGEEGAEVSGTLALGAAEPAPLAQGKLVPGGVRLGALAAKPGDTVKLVLEGGPAPFLSWGLVAEVQEGGAAVRFAGLNPDDENKLRELFKAKGLSLPIAPQKPPPPKPPPAVMRPVAPPAEPRASLLSPPSGQASEGPTATPVTNPGLPTAPVTQPGLAAAPADPSQPLPNAAPGIAPLGPPPGMRVAPTGPPPGFADRPHIRPHVATGKVPPRAPTPMGLPVPGATPSAPPPAGSSASPPTGSPTTSPPTGSPTTTTGATSQPLAIPPAPNAATPPAGAAQPVAPALANAPSVTPAAGAATPVGSPATTPPGAPAVQPAPPEPTAAAPGHASAAEGSPAPAPI